MTSDAILPPDPPTLDDLAAYALDAVDRDEQLAIGTHVEADGGAATTERALRAAAGELGASGVVNVDTAPPPALRDRVLAAARARRPPATAPEMTPVAMHRVELARAIATLRRLGPDEWALPLDPPELAGWTVHDAVVHLAANEALLAQALGAPLSAVPESATGNEARTAAARERHAGRPPADAVDELEAAAAAVDTHVSPLDDEQLDRMVEFWERPTSITGSLFMRSFETWTHTDDVRRAIGAAEVPPPAPVLDVLCRAAVTLVPRMLRAQGVEPPERLVRFRLDGPGAAPWDITLPDGVARPAGDGPADAELFVDTVALCRAVSARLPEGGLPYTSRGDADLAAQIIESVPALAVV